MNDERGSMTLWALGLSLILFGVGFLALDLWNAFSARSEAAAVADSAAIAGATADRLPVAIGLHGRSWARAAVVLSSAGAWSTSEQAGSMPPGTASRME